MVAKSQARFFEVTFTRNIKLRDNGKSVRLIGVTLPLWTRRGADGANSRVKPVLSHQMHLGPVKDCHPVVVDVVLDMDILTRSQSTIGSRRYKLERIAMDLSSQKTKAEDKHDPIEARVHDEVRLARRAREGVFSLKDTRKDVDGWMDRWIIKLSEWKESVKECFAVFEKRKGGC